MDPYVLGIYTKWFFAAAEVCGTLMIDREIYETPADGEESSRVGKVLGNSRITRSNAVSQALFGRGFNQQCSCTSST